MEKSLHLIGLTAVLVLALMSPFQSAAAPKNEDYVPPEDFKEAQRELNVRAGELASLQNPAISRRNIEDFISDFNKLLEEEARGKLSEDEPLVYAQYADVLGMWRANQYIELDADVSTDWMIKVQAVILGMDNARKKRMLFREDLRNVKNPAYKALLDESLDWRKKLIQAEKRIAKPTNQAAINQLKTQRKARIQVLEYEIRILERELPRLERLEQRKKQDEKKAKRS